MLQKTTEVDHVQAMFEGDGSVTVSIFINDQTIRLPLSETRELYKAIGVIIDKADELLAVEK